MRQDAKWTNGRTGVSANVRQTSTGLCPGEPKEVQGGMDEAGEFGRLPSMGTTDSGAPWNVPYSVSSRSVQAMEMVPQQRSTRRKASVAEADDPDYTHKEGGEADTQDF